MRVARYGGARYVLRGTRCVLRGAGCVLRDERYVLRVVRCGFSDCGFLDTREAECVVILKSTQFLPVMPDLIPAEDGIFDRHPET